MDRQHVTGSAQIIRGNALDLALADDSVDLIVTSPPYFGLRSYQDGGEHYEGQIGDEATPAEFVDALVAATAEMVRVLKPSGSIWVNLGDKYAGSAAGGTQNGACGKGGTDGNRKRGNVRTAAGAMPRTSVPPKSLIGVPWRYALRCIDDLGLILRAEVVWAKPNGLPESVTDRVRRSHETWFHFTKSPRYFSAVDEIREAHAPASLVRYAGSTDPIASGRARADSASGITGGGTAHAGPNPLGKLPGSVWTIPTQPLRVPESLGIDHFAAFPMEWPRRIIKGWAPTRGVCVECGEGRRPVSATTLTKDRGGSKEQRAADSARGGTQDFAATTLGRERHVTITGETCACVERHRECREAEARDEPDAMCDDCYDVANGLAEPSLSLPPTSPAIILDPFGGTGTTALVAKALGCHGISNDMSADYCRLAQWRTTDEGELARAMQVDKPAAQVQGQASLLDLIDGLGA